MDSPPAMEWRTDPVEVFPHFAADRCAIVRDLIQNYKWQSILRFVEQLMDVLGPVRLVDSLERLNMRRRVAMFLDPPLCAAAGAGVGAIDECGKSRRKRLDVARRNDPAGLVVLDDLRQSAGVRDDRRQAVGSRFERNPAERFFQRRNDGHIEPRVDAAYVVDKSNELDSVVGVDPLS